MCPWTRKIFPRHNEWYIGNVLDCAHVSSKQSHGTYCLCSFTQLFRCLTMLISKPCSGGFKSTVVLTLLYEMIGKQFIVQLLHNTHKDSERSVNFCYVVRTVQYPEATYINYTVQREWLVTQY